MTLLLVVALPFSGAAALAILGQRIGRKLEGAILVGSLVIAFGAALAIAQAFTAGKISLVAELGAWLPLRGADLTLVVVPASVPLVVGITALAALVALSAVATLGDRDAARFGAAFGLTVGGGLLVVVASNLMLLFAGWELVAAGTYLLVAQDRDRPASAAAGLRSFVVARVGDTALLVATLALLATFRSTDLGEIAQHVGGAAQPGATSAAGVVLVSSSLVLVAALVRSAQLPFHLGLTDSAEASAAGSALIQAVATTGGVVLLLRLASILDPNALIAATAIGAATAVIGGLVASAQAEPRRLLLWSTVSQLGVAFVAVGSGAQVAALFAMLAHAFAKAALILSADARATRVGATAFAAGGVALAAVPLTAGYLAITTVASGVGVRPDLLAFFLVTAVLTVVYVGRVLLSAPLPSWLDRAARSGSQIDRLCRRAFSASFRAAVQVLDRGSERVLEQSAALVGEAAMGAAELASAAHRRYARASEAIVLGAALALVAYWTLR